MEAGLCLRNHFDGAVWLTISASSDSKELAQRSEKENEVAVYCKSRFVGE